MIDRLTARLVGLLLLLIVAAYVHPIALGLAIGTCVAAVRDVAFARPRREHWHLWRAASGLPGICPANAHSVLIWRTSLDPRIDGVCRADLARNGSCWCGKLRKPETRP